MNEQLLLCAYILKFWQRSSRSAFLQTTRESTMLHYCFVTSARRGAHSPLLWTNLNLCFRSLVDSNVHAVVDGIHTWLGRSGILPLTIHFCCSEWERCSEKVLQVCDALSKYASRWKCVDVAVPRIILASWPNLLAVPLLHALRIRLLFDKIPFTSAPCLARVHLVSVCSTVIPHIPWHQLVDLTIAEWKSDDSILQLIVRCPLLDSINVRILGFATGGPVCILPVEHAVLRNIKFCVGNDKHTILESLVVPGLKFLSLCDDTMAENSDQPRIHSNLLELVNKSHCELLELNLVHCRFNQLIELLEHRSCRTLTSLRLENFSASQNMFDELLFRLTRVDGMTEDSLCPELTHLTLTCYPDYTSAGMLGKMILSRSRKMENRLGSFELFIAYRNLAETDQALLKRAKENGLKLHINHGIRWICLGTNDDSEWA